MHRCEASENRPGLPPAAAGAVRAFQAMTRRAAGSGEAPEGNLTKSPLVFFHFSIELQEAHS